MTKTGFPEEVSAEELADLLGVTPKTVRNHADRGVVVRSGRGKYLVPESIRNLIADARKASRNNELDREQLALVREKRKAAELRNAQAAGELIELTEATGVLDEIIGVFRVGLDGLAPRITRDLTLRKAIRTECEAMLVAASRKFEQLAQHPPTTNSNMKEDGNDE
ncbi:type IV toxin-antitoxin system AbiEi family antitoxin domain-containing protein [Xanthobacter sp. V3C-3]|uniref:type IV toxin-antitoxin system AbiEi family antitoxin domain-containing protein n=1 Tax=Xanthobacter lutulentifluminis TaxID=3119935 RepID=UPI003727A5E9